MLQQFSHHTFFLALFTFVLSIGINHYLEIDEEVLTAAFLSLSVLLIYRFQQKISGDGIFNYLLVGLILFLLLQINPGAEALLMLTVNLLVSIFYVYPKKFSLRTVPFLKLFLIAFVWTSSLVLFPQFVRGGAILWQLSLFLYLFFIIIALPFDMRDVEQDRGQLKTFPTFFGIKRSRMGLIALILVLWFSNLFWSIFSFSNWFFHLACIQLLLSSLFLFRIKAKTLFFLLFDTSLIIIGLSFYFE